MTEIQIALFVGVLFIVGTSILLVAEKFKRGALGNRRIRHSDIWAMVVRSLKITFLGWLGFFVVFVTAYFMAEDASIEELGVLIFCFGGLFFYAVLVPAGYVVFLWAVVKLPIVSEVDDQRRTS